MDEPLAAAAVLSALRRLGRHVSPSTTSAPSTPRSPTSSGCRSTSLKIDRSFVDTLEDADSSDATLIAAVVAMAHALGITTIAEGVETTMQAHRLMELGCDALQGFLYSRPVRAEGFPTWSTRCGSRARTCFRPSHPEQRCRVLAARGPSGYETDGAVEVERA